MSSIYSTYTSASSPKRRKIAVNYVLDVRGFDNKARYLLNDNQQNVVGRGKNQNVYLYNPYVLKSGHLDIRLDDGKITIYPWEQVWVQLSTGWLAATRPFEIQPRMSFSIFHPNANSVPKEWDFQMRIEASNIFSEVTVSQLPNSSIVSRRDSVLDWLHSGNRPKSSKENSSSQLKSMTAANKSVPYQNVILGRQQSSHGSTITIASTANSHRSRVANRTLAELRNSSNSQRPKSQLNFMDDESNRSTSHRVSASTAVAVAQSADVVNSLSKTQIPNRSLREASSSAILQSRSTPGTRRTITPGPIYSISNERYSSTIANTELAEKNSSNSLLLDNLEKRKSSNRAIRETNVVTDLEVSLEATRRLADNHTSCTAYSSPIANSNLVQDNNRNSLLLDKLEKENSSNRSIPETYGSSDLEPSPNNDYSKTNFSLPVDVEAAESTIFGRSEVIMDDYNTLPTRLVLPDMEMYPKKVFRNAKASNGLLNYAFVTFSYMCKQCGVTFDNINNLNGHTRQKYRSLSPTDANTNGFMIVCPNKEVDYFDKCCFALCWVFTDPGNYKHYTNNHPCDTKEGLKQLQKMERSLAADLFAAMNSANESGSRAQFYMLNKSETILNTMLHRNAFSHFELFLSLLPAKLHLYNSRIPYDGSQIYIVIHNNRHEFTLQISANTVETHWLGLIEDNGNYQIHFAQNYCRFATLVTADIGILELAKGCIIDYCKKHWDFKHIEIDMPLSD